MKLGTRVRIISGMVEFVGATGEVTSHEKDGATLLNWVRLDSPVFVSGVGSVTDDLWSNSHLKNLDAQRRRNANARARNATLREICGTSAAAARRDGGF